MFLKICPSMDPFFSSSRRNYTAARHKWLLAPLDYKPPKSGGGESTLYLINDDDDVGVIFMQGVHI